MKLLNKKPALPAVCAVIVGAGSSQRMGGENKLLIPLGGTPVLAHTLLAFERCEYIRDIVLVCREGDIAPYAALAMQFSVSKLRTTVRGGNNRTASALAGILSAPTNTELIAIHDAARPLVSDEIISETVSAAMEYGAAAPIVPLKDSIKRLRNDMILSDVSRSSLGAVQTPQIFHRSVIQSALERAVAENQTFTDDCAAVESAGQPIRATTGSYRNIKITTYEDVVLAEALLTEQEKEAQLYVRR